MKKSEIELITTVIDECAKSNLENVFSSLADLPASSTKAEMLSHCLNQELGAYGFKTYISPDKTTVLIDDNSMCQIVDFFKGTGYQPVLTTEHIERVKTLVNFAEKGKVDLLWAQSGIQKKYYYAKQYGFNGLNLYNLLQINTINAATAAYAATGAAAFTMAGVVALSWSGSLFLSTVENYVPNSMPKTKLVISAVKFTVALPIRCVEWTSNQMFGIVEKVITGQPLPTNITEVYKLNVGPKLRDMRSIKRPVLEFLIKNLEKWK